ncbi:hypothetical protein ACWDQ0_36895 [Streptomyces sp. NPDC003642]
MIVRFAGGPLARIELETTDASWVGGWLTVGDADWGCTSRCTATR